MSVNDFDYLASCLSLLAKRRSRLYSENALKDGLPLQDGQLNIVSFKRAAIRAGFKSEVVRRGPESLSTSLFPLIIICKDKSAFILESFEDGLYTIYDVKDSCERQLNVSELTELSSGFAILVQDLQESEARTEKENWFFATLYKYRSMYAWALVASVFINLFALNSSIFIMTVYDRVLPNNAESTLWMLSAVVIGAFVFDFIFKTVRSATLDRITQRVEVILSSKIHEKLMRVNMTHKPPSAGHFASVVKDFESIRDFMTSMTLTALIDLPFALCILFFIYLIAGKLTLVLVACALVLLVVNVLAQPLQKMLVGKSMDEGSRRQGRLVEVVNNLDIIRMMNAQSIFQYKWEQDTGVLSETSRKSKFASSVTLSISSIIQNMVSIFVVIGGFYLIRDENMTMGQLVAVVILGGRALGPLVTGINLLVRYQYVRKAYKNVDNFMRLPEERDPDSSLLSRPDINGEVVLEKVGFSYPNQIFRALDNISFKINKGEKVGIIGNVSSGKSTLLRLILGLYTSTEGKILVDGTDCRQVDSADLRESMSCISQEAKLFDGSVRDNLFYANPHLSHEELDEVVKISGLDKLLNSQPMGLDLPVGEGGSHLSGGQRQLVAIAQAVAKNPPIILMDEPTSSLDTGAEAEFLTKMKEFTKDKTLILSTHKMRELQLVDRIIVLDKGLMIADGPRDKVLEVLQNKGKK